MATDDRRPGFMQRVLRACEFGFGVEQIKALLAQQQESAT